MNRYIKESPSLPSVSLRSLYSYLTSHGWQKIENFGESGLVYGLENQPLELLVPTVMLSDFRRRIGEILQTLSEVEGRDPLAILRDVSLSEYDLIRVRLTELDAGGSVPVSDGFILFQESRNLLLAAACSVSRPQRAYRAGRNQEASDYMNSVRYGQTEMGSFMVSLLSPVPPNLGGQSDMSTRLPAEPFARRVTRKLVSGLRSAREAISFADYGGDISAFERSVSQGVSANLCDSIAGLLDFENRQSIDVSVSWSLVREPPEDRAQITFNSSDISVLKEASRILKDRQERPNERIDGLVTFLARGQTETRGRATLKAVVDGTMSSVRVEFAPTDYSRIVEAHDEKRVVSLEGDLRRDGQRWVLDNPRDLEVQTDDEE